MSGKPSETPVGATKETFDQEKYDISTGIVSQMWHSFSYAEGVLLTQAEAILGDDLRCKAYKNMLKREIRRLQQNVQQVIYEGWKQQEHEAFPEPLLEEED